MKRGKILYVRGSFAPINFSSYNVQEIGLLKGFCNLGFDCDFIYLTNKTMPSWEYTVSNHVLRVIPMHGIRVLRTRINFNILKSEFLDQYDLIISAEYGQIMTYLLSKVSDKVIMYSGPYYNLFKIPFVSLVYDFLFTKAINKNCKGKFVKSQLAKDYLEKKGYTDITVIGVGLDVDRFNEEIDITPETKQIQQYMKNNPCVLYVGSLSERKNFSFLIQVFNKLCVERTGVHLVVIGKGNDSYISSCLKEIDDFSKKSILFVNSLDNSQLRYIYPYAKAFLLPSKKEIFGMVLLEAMYLGAPVISSFNGGSATLIQGMDTGTIINDFNVDTWVQTIKSYLDSPERISEITDKAHSLVSKKYIWIEIAKRILTESHTWLFSEDDNEE